MDTPRVIKIKRRTSGNVGPPSTLMNGELAFNELDQTLYYGSGDVGNGVAANIISIAGGFTSLLKNSSIETITTPTTASNDYLVVEINGILKAIRLFDF